MSTTCDGRARDESQERCYAVEVAWVAQASVATPEAVLGWSRSATSRGGAGECGNVRAAAWYLRQVVAVDIALAVTPHTAPRAACSHRDP